MENLSATIKTVRHAPLGRTVVAHAPSRVHRPLPMLGIRPVHRCPFCPGHEDDCEPEIDQVAAGARWGARSFANRWPMVRPGSGGHHEVLVISPAHDRHLGELSGPELEPFVELLTRRVTHHDGAEAIVVWAASGKAAGASQPHPHAQLVALEDSVPFIESEAEHLAGDSCLLCAPVAPERVVVDGHVRAWVPDGAHMDHELILAPRDHDRMPGVADGSELARALALGFAAQRGVTEAAPFNLVFHVGPAGRDFHWHAHLLPRRAVIGGAELSGLWATTVDEDLAASQLRAALDQ